MIRGGARAHVDIDRTVRVERADALRGSSDMGLFASLEPPVFLVDGNNLLWRAAHGRPAPFTAADGRDLTPLFRFMSQLRRAVGTYGVFSECVVCFDGAEGWTTRQRIDERYKSNRDYADKDLSFMEWLPEIIAALLSAGVAYAEVPDREADDVIATLAKQAGERPVRIFSTDHDYFQLLCPRVTVAAPRRRPAVMDATSLERHYGVRPHQWCDYRALAGDPSDGIPGLPGIGSKRAAELLSCGLTLDEMRVRGLLDHGIGRMILDRWSDVTRYRDLIRLVDDAPVPALTGEPTPTLPPASKVCLELGLLG